MNTSQLTGIQQEGTVNSNTMLEHIHNTSVWWVDVTCTFLYTCGAPSIMYMDHSQALSVAPLPRNWNLWSGRPHHIWLQTIKVRFFHRKLISR